MDPPAAWWNVAKRTNKQSEANKEHRFSKASIGQPISLQNSADSFSDNSNCPAMTMKCIILQKNEKGFGLTVSGENPIYVQSVKEDGAAHKAGVHEGDRIIKVNGTNVTEYGHIEVVRLIKADSYVALTLLGVPAGSNSGQNSGDSQSQHTSHSSDHGGKTSSNKSHVQNPFYDQKVETIKRMLEQSRDEYERIKDEYAKTPCEKLLLDLRGAQTMKQDLEKRLWRANTSLVSSSASSSVASTMPPPPTNKTSSSIITDIDESLGLEEKSDLRSKRGISSSAMDLRSPTDFETSVIGHRSTDLNGSRTRGSSDNMLAQIQAECPALQTDGGGLGGGKTPTVTMPAQNPNIINFEDDDMVEDCDADHGPFNDLEGLKQRPAHFAVFLNYVLQSHEPQNLLFLISVDSYKTISSMKDMSRQAEIIYKNFLHSTACFKVAVDESMTKSIYSITKSKNPSDDALRCMFDPAVQLCTKTIRDQLGNYRTKREQGLGNMFGDEKLPPGEQPFDAQHEARLVDELIGSKTQEIQQMTSSLDLSNERLNVVQEILNGFVSMYGTKRSKGKLDRIQTLLQNKKNKNIGNAGRQVGRISSGTSTETINEDSKSNKNHRNRFNFKHRGKDSERKNKSSAATPMVASATMGSSKSSSHHPLQSRRPTSEPLATGKMSRIEQSIRSKSVYIAQTVSTSSTMPAFYNNNGGSGNPDLIPTAEHAQRMMQFDNQLTSSRTAELETADSLPRNYHHHSNQPHHHNSVSSAATSIRTSASADTAGSVTSSSSSAATTSTADHTSSASTSSYHLLQPPQSTSDMSIPGTGGSAGSGAVPSGGQQSLNFRGSASNHDLESMSLMDTVTKKPSRSGSFRSYRTNEKRSGTSKSHSDPDKDKVEYAVNQHSITTNDQHQMDVTDHPRTTGHEHRNTNNKQPHNFSLNDAELSFEDEIKMVPWSESVPHDVKKKTPKMEIKRQEIFNELLLTEQNHIHHLNIMDKLFYQQLKKNNVLDTDELKTMFANLHTVYNLHSQFNSDLQKVKDRDGHVVKEVGDALISRFDDEAGEEFKREAATFCANNAASNRFIKERPEKDPKFKSALAELQSHRSCQKLHLQDFIAKEFQRISKYPMLLQGLITNTKNNNKHAAELGKLRKAHEKSKSLLDYVNAQLRIAQDKELLTDIQNNLDRSPCSKLADHEIVKEFRDIDLLEHPVVHHGKLQCTLGLMDQQNKKEINMYAIVYKHVIVFMEQHVNGKYTLKTQSKTGHLVPPFVRIEDLIVRSNAAVKNGFFMIANSAKSTMYEWVGQSAKAVQTWIKILEETINEYNQNFKNPKTSLLQQRTKNPSVSPSSSRRHDTTDGPSSEQVTTTAEDRLASADDEDVGAGTSSSMYLDTTTHQDLSSNNRLPAASSLSASTVEGEHHHHVSSAALQRQVEAEHELRAKQEEVNSLWRRKRQLLAEIANTDLPNLDTVLEMSVLDDDADSKTLCLDALRNVDRLQEIFNNTTVPENVYVVSSRDRNSWNMNKQQQRRHSNASDHQRAPPADDTSTTTTTGYNSERWAIPVEHPHHQDDTTHDTVSTPDEVSELEAETSQQQQPTIPDQLALHTDPVDNSLYERLTTPSSHSRMHHSNPTSPRPQSVDARELMAGTGLIPVDDVTSLLHNLHTQLARLMKKIGDKEEPRRLLMRHGSNDAFVEDDLRKDQPPPTYEEVQAAEAAADEDGSCFNVSPPPSQQLSTVTTPLTAPATITLTPPDESFQPSHPTTLHQFQYRNRANAATSTSTPHRSKSVGGAGHVTSSPRDHPLTNRSQSDKLPSLRESEGESSARNPVHHRATFSQGRATAF